MIHISSFIFQSIASFHGLIRACKCSIIGSCSGPRGQQTLVVTSHAARVAVQTSLLSGEEMSNELQDVLLDSTVFVVCSELLSEGCQHILLQWLGAKEAVDCIVASCGLKGYWLVFAVPHYHECGPLRPNATYLLRLMVQSDGRVAARPHKVVLGTASRLDVLKHTWCVVTVADKQTASSTPVQEKPSASGGSNKRAGDSHYSCNNHPPLRLGTHGCVTGNIGNMYATVTVD
jgi:hypothetical protein